MTELEKGLKKTLPRSGRESAAATRAALAALAFAACTHPRADESREARRPDAVEADRQIQRLLDPSTTLPHRLLREQTLEWLLARPDDTYLKLLARVDVDAPSPLAIAALPRFGRGDCVPVLERLLRHADDPTALVAARALAEHSSPEALAALERALHDPRDPVVTSAAAGLARRGDRAACPALAAAITHASPDVRGRVAAATARLVCDSP